MNLLNFWEKAPLPEADDLIKPVDMLATTPALDRGRPRFGATGSLKLRPPAQ